MAEMYDVIVPITGRRGAGKDTLAKMAVEKFNCAGSVALSDWFKRVLSKQFKLPLEDFYSSKKDEPFSQPIVITVKTLRALKDAIQASLGARHDMRITRISISKWDGLEIKSIRDLMVWFGHEFVTLNLGHEFHNYATEAALKAIPREESFNTIFVTDARQFPQSNYYNLNYKFVYPVRIVRPDGSADASAPEKATEEFPEGYFFAEVINDGTLEDLEKKVLALLEEIREDIKLRVYGAGKPAGRASRVPRGRKVQPKALGYNIPTHEAKPDSGSVSNATTETGK